MYEIKFKFYPEVLTLQAGEIEIINHELFEIEEFLDWSLTDIYTDEWTDRGDVMDFTGDILKVLDPQTGETATIKSPYRIKKFLDWNLTDIYIYEWTTGEDVLGLFS